MKKFMLMFCLLLVGCPQGPDVGMLPSNEASVSELILDSFGSKIIVVEFEGFRYTMHNDNGHTILLRTEQVTQVTQVTGN